MARCETTAIVIVDGDEGSLRCTKRDGHHASIFDRALGGFAPQPTAHRFTFEVDLDGSVDVDPSDGWGS